VELTQEMKMSKPELCVSLQACQKLKSVCRTSTWQLAPQRAMSLLPRKNSQLLIVQGCAWITWDGPMELGSRRGGDHFLEAGQVMNVPAGVSLVMQARHAHETLHFDWREMPSGLAPHRPSRTALRELVRQWRRAWLALGGASMQLALGLWHHSASARPLPICRAE
jgi:Protein of unknown function (DUF2917)